MDRSIIEIIGYLATITVAISLSLKNFKRLRIYNLIGSLAFCIYAIMINALPVAIVNGYIVLINIYFLYKMYNTKELFDCIEVPTNDQYLGKFVEQYKQDILAYFPDFNRESLEGAVAVISMRDAVPAGIFIYRNEGEESARILVDYVTPSFRDTKNGKFLFDIHTHLFRDRLIKRVSVETTHKKHIKYIQKLGFLPITGKPGMWEKSV